MSVNSAQAVSVCVRARALVWTFDMRSALELRVEGTWYTHRLSAAVYLILNLIVIIIVMNEWMRTTIIITQLCLI